MAAVASPSIERAHKARRRKKLNWNVVTGESFCSFPAIYSYFQSDGTATAMMIATAGCIARAIDGDRCDSYGNMQSFCKAEHNREISFICEMHQSPIRRIEH